jgi:uncharacterized protein YutD
MFGCANHFVLQNVQHQKNKLDENENKSLGKGLSFFV